MTLKKFFLLLIAILLLFNCQNKIVLAEEKPVIINEIAWMGSEKSSANEWIELFNQSEETILLDGWILQSSDNSPKINLSGKIKANNYFLLERTDDQTVKNVLANQIYTGALANSGEKLELIDNQNNLIDSVDAQEGWFAGDNEEKKTMERTGKDSQPSNWQDSAQSGGTPKLKNTNDKKQESDTTNQDNTKKETITQPNSTSTTAANTNHSPIAKTKQNKITALINQKITFSADKSYDPDNQKLSFAWNFGDGQISTQANPQHSYSYPGQYITTLEVSDGELSDITIIKINIYTDSIIISEFIPNPEGKDKNNEWIEIHNQSSQIANLSKWQIDDESGGSSPFTIPNHTIIGPKQFLTIKRSVSGLALNNSQDQVRLFYPDGSLANQIDYSKKHKEGYAIAKKGNQYFWTNQPTPNSENIITLSKQKKSNISTSTTAYYNVFDFFNQTLVQPKIKISKKKKFSAKNPKKHSQDSTFLAPFIAKAQTPTFSDLTSLKPTPNKTSKTNQKQNNTKTKPLSQATKPNYEKSKAMIFDQNYPKLILILSILISGGLFLSWIIIMLKP